VVSTLQWVITFASSYLSLDDDNTPLLLHDLTLVIGAHKPDTTWERRENGNPEQAKKLRITWRMCAVYLQPMITNWHHQAPNYCGVREVPVTRPITRASSTST